MSQPNKFICIHGHFYQPPRENAWLEVIEWQESAHPYHDWNERITAECYAPNTASRILDEHGVIKNITNNYSRISFNFGPTLLSWMEANEPETYEAILQADRESMRLFGGHGSALAQVYNHLIMPLANARDKETQIIWGIRDFEFRFGRQPEGMWLAETAVDVETLELLAANGIKFTILAPHQAAAVRATGDDRWHQLRPGEINTRRAYECPLPSGKTINLFFYNGAVSQAVAFNGLLNNGQHFAETLLDSFGSENEPQLVHIATDGETYGHHHKHGDMALAYCLEYIEQKPGVALANYGWFLEMFPPRYQVQIAENTSWSCVHGVERWRSNCGCNTGRQGFHQEWRKPLREALDWLRDRLNECFEKEASAAMADPWQARNDYINVILKRNDESIRKFLREHQIKSDQPARIMRLMEMQRNAQLMYTSCGWFFDEISGIETTQILQYACRAIQLASQLTEQQLEEEFIRRLSLAPSNYPQYNDGAGVYRQLVLPSRVSLQRVGMHYAVALLFEEDPENFPVFNYSTQNDFFLKKEAGEQRLVLGITRIRSHVTWSEKVFSFAALYLGKHNIIGSISINMKPDDFASMQVRVVKAFEEARLADVISLMQAYFGPEHYTIWHLFKDEKRKVLNLITRQSLAELEESLRRVYNRDYPLMNALRHNQMPVPRTYLTLLEYILNADLTASFRSVKINLRRIERIMQELAAWKLNIDDPEQIARLAGDRIFKELRSIAAERSNTKRVERLNRLFPLLRRFKLEPNLYKSQNLYFEISRQEQVNDKSRTAEWRKQFELLGKNLGVKVSL
ncbi:MAG: glycoside hydrolase [Cyclobacteriaceae bacterium]|nr:MAG: glycoside hydrolase [Cyclobacteriaceae bacterium]